jgi:hypothetical protein
MRKTVQFLNIIKPAHKVETQRRFKERAISLRCKNINNIETDIRIIKEGRDSSKNFHRTASKLFKGNIICIILEL